MITADLIEPLFLPSATRPSISVRALMVSLACARKTYLNPRSVILSKVPKVSHGTWCFSAMAEDGKPTPLWKAPISAWTLSFVISRSVSVTPVSASPRVSPKKSLILAPRSDLMPPALLTSSAAMVMAFFCACPNLAVGPVSGLTIPMRISSAGWAADGAAEPASRARTTASTGVSRRVRIIAPPGALARAPHGRHGPLKGLDDGVEIRLGHHGAETGQAVVADQDAFVQQVHEQGADALLHARRDRVAIRPERRIRHHELEQGAVAGDLAGDAAAGQRGAQPRAQPLAHGGQPREGGLVQRPQRGEAGHHGDRVGA